MRVTSLLAGLAALAFSQAALAASVNVAPVSYSPEFQEALNDDLGAREGEYLSRAVHEAVANALAERGATLGGGELTIEISIIDADPNRPTMQQLANQPGLDPIRSVSIGGAELRAVLRNSSGDVVSEVTHRRYNHSLADLNGASTTWTEANRAIRQFARKVADAYTENAR
jgi:hypothetical protein